MDRTFLEIYPIINFIVLGIVIAVRLGSDKE